MVEDVPLNSTPRMMTMTVNINGHVYAPIEVYGQLSPSLLSKDLSDHVLLVDGARNPTRYVSRPCFEKTRRVVVVRPFDVKNFKKDVVIPTEVPMIAYEQNSGFDYKYCCSVSALMDPVLSREEYDKAAMYGRLALGLGLYSPSFFNLVAYDRVFRRFLYLFFMGASRLSSVYSKVYCLAPPLSDSDVTYGSPLYLSRIVVCTPDFEKVRRMAEAHRDKAILMFSGLEGKRLADVWLPNEKYSSGLSRAEDVLLLPGGEVRFIEKAWSNSIPVYVFGPGDRRWDWNSQIMR